jgi:hypothetical protein
MPGAENRQTLAPTPVIASTYLSGTNTHRVHRAP